MEPKLRGNQMFVFILFILFSIASSQNDLYLDFCGTWRHGRVSLRLAVNISTGCDGISINANSSTMSINGHISAKCQRSDVIPLTDQFGFDLAEESNFCLYWEPLLDQLKLQFRGKNFTLCWPASPQGSCCTDLSLGSNTPEARYGITKGMVKNDVINDKIMTGYNFKGASTDCKNLCDQWTEGSTQVNMSVRHQAVGLVEHPCARSTEVEMMDDFKGYSVTWPPTQGVSAESTVTVQIPTALKQAAKVTNKVVCTFFKNNFFFQESVKNIRILDDVVEITVENEIIINLPDPVRVNFYHDVILESQSRECVSWDTRKDPLQVNWTTDGCETRKHGKEHTECLCNHLTYFSILVSLEPRPVCHLLALSVITSLGCATSLISCVALIIYLYRQSKKNKELSIHFGLAVSLALLNLLFFFTGVLANVVGESECAWVAAGLHYSLLASLTWMGIEVFHTFWLVYFVYSPTPSAWVWNTVGFALPVVPVVILGIVGDIYGVRKLPQCHDPSDPYRMCWMKDNDKALLAHYVINLTVLVIVVVSGLVMLFLVYQKIRNRAEWKQKRMAFLSMWGLSCLYGTTWGLIFLSSGHLSAFFIFIFCFLNSFQGFFLMLRFWIVNWFQRHTKGTAMGNNSTGSSGQHMLQSQETTSRGCQLG